MGEKIQKQQKPLTHSLREPLKLSRPDPTCLHCKQPIDVRHVTNGYMHKACEKDASTGKRVWTPGSDLPVLLGPDGVELAAS